MQAKKETKDFGIVSGFIRVLAACIMLMCIAIADWVVFIRALELEKPTFEIKVAGALMLIVSVGVVIVVVSILKPIWEKEQGSV